ncbi:MAG: hypothetical protein IKN27_08230 [Selenomonadaceae bacterium]|nr:hypothetical protein [Selenomonadaceae bacterium]
MAGANTTITGLKDVYYAVMTDDDAVNGATYGTPVKLGHAISMDIQPNTESATLYGDNRAIATKTKLKEITVTIETSDIPLKDRAIMLGHTTDSSTGKVTVKGDDKAVYVAILFAATTAEDTTQYYKFLKGKFAPSQQQIETEGEGINWQTPTMEGTFIARSSDGKIYEMVDSADSGAATLINDWFQSV